jgi:hypothetical protein
MMSHSADSRPVSVGLIALVVILTFSSGCGRRPDPLPTTYPVHGVVEYKDGSLVTGGLVQFFPEADSSVLTAGTIEDDGSFSLTTTRPKQRSTGAVAGPNRVGVRVSSAKDATSQASPISFGFPKPFVVEPHDNNFTLVIDLSK